LPELVAFYGRLSSKAGDVWIHPSPQQHNQFVAVADLQLKEKEPAKEKGAKFMIASM